MNLCILLLAAVNLSGVEGTDTLEGAYDALGVALGPVIATLFAVGLLASGLALTSIGAYAGAEIMCGLLRVRVPLILRRLVTLVPALAILWLGFDPTLSLVLSQVVLSFGIPFALVPLDALPAKAGVLGRWLRPELWRAFEALDSRILACLGMPWSSRSLRGHCGVTTPGDPGQPRLR